MKTSPLRAISLLEVLAVFFIIAVLAGLILPLISTSRTRARGANDLNNLRQLGLAANLYHEQEGYWPRGTDNLVHAGLIPVTVCSFMNDPSRSGIANGIREKEDELPWAPIDKGPVSYRNSPAGFRDFAINPVDALKWVEASTDGGWLVDFSTVHFPSERVRLQDPECVYCTGSYRRLGFDGAVIERNIRRFELGEPGQKEMGIPVICYFVDPSNEMMQWLDSL